MGGHPNGGKHEYGNKGIRAPLPEGIEKGKRALIDEFTRLTGYRRKSAVREVLVSTGGKTAKLKPEKKGPANREGKRVYGDEVIAPPRLFRTFFWRKRGNILAPFMRRQMEYIGQRTASPSPRLGAHRPLI